MVPAHFDVMGDRDAEFSVEGYGYFGNPIVHPTPVGQLDLSAPVRHQSGVSLLHVVSQLLPATDSEPQGSHLPPVVVVR